MEEGEERENKKDEEILIQSLERPGLFEQLVLKYQDSFLRTAYRILNNKEEAEDVVQDAFVKIYFNAKKFKKQEGIEFKSWAFKILINTALSRYRKIKRSAPAAEYNDALLIAIEDKNFDRLFKQRDDRDLIESVFRQMPKELACVLKQHYLEDMSYQEISRRERLSIGALKMKLFRARKLFKEILSLIS
ncbi:MAG: RNA polymerase sigma factor [Minisyncoccales bacterium]